MFPSVFCRLHYSYSQLFLMRSGSFLVILVALSIKLWFSTFKTKSVNKKKHEANLHIRVIICGDFEYMYMIKLLDSV